MNYTSQMTNYTLQTTNYTTLYKRQTTLHIANGCYQARAPSSRLTIPANAHAETAEEKERIRAGRILHNTSGSAIARASEPPSVHRAAVLRGLAKRAQEDKTSTRSVGRHKCAHASKSEPPDPKQPFGFESDIDMHLDNDVDLPDNPAHGDDFSAAADDFPKPRSVNHDEENIPCETSLVAPGPVEITINNPLSTLALAAAKVNLPAPLEPDPQDSSATACSTDTDSTVTSALKAMAASKLKSGGKAVKMCPSATKNGRLTNPLVSSSTATSAESSPLDTPELRTKELDSNDTEPDDSEYESKEVQQQLEKDDEKDDEDQESLEGAPDKDSITLPTFSTTSAFLAPFPILQPPFTATSPQLLAPHRPRTPIKPPPNPKVPPQPSPRREDELTKVTVFSTLLSAGSIADTWWSKLDASEKNTWADVKTAFTNRWPAITVVEKTGLDYQHKILALRLVEEELGVQVTIADVPTWSHLQFHASLQQLVNEAGPATMAGLIYQVRENLPMIMKELTTPGLTEWKKFLTEIKSVDTNKLREKAQASRMKKEVEKAQNA
ncbi:hypothetical protein DFH29DRAFT_1007220 [Suillus ampliporus]|nr:hypothetical protein DFH29DRAFT_1007220 [Suillus ampliporus]